jgi:ribosome-interacting GTPase 1
LKAKLAKLKRELLNPTTSGGGAGAGFDVARTGVASVYVSPVTLQQDAI